MRLGYGMDPRTVTSSVNWINVFLHATPTAIQSLRDSSVSFPLPHTLIMCQSRSLLLRIT